MLTSGQREDIIRKWNAPSSSLFAHVKDRSAVRKIVEFAKEHAVMSNKLTATQLMVVGMPNVGKSSLLNAQPGITRKIASSVKIVEREGDQEGVYVLDTPGVFVPYVPDAESMLKLALCGSVKDTVIPPTRIADYLLYRLNVVDPALYQAFSEPTNDIHVLLEGLARKQGRLKKGGMPNIDAAALSSFKDGELARWESSS
jgi:ribosome biogenesis GTPase A